MSVAGSSIRRGPMDQDELRLFIQRKVAAGELPCERHPATWLGHGSGRRCDACGRPVGPADYEAECDIRGGPTLRFHRDCFFVWDDICRTLTG